MIMQDYNGSSKISTAQIIDAIGPVEGRVISIFEEKILADSNVNVLREPRTDKGWKYFLTFSGRKYFEIFPNTIGNAIKLSIINRGKQ